MPPKRSMRKRTCVKQKRDIKSRLMLLSFQVDDYIYNKIPITTTDAHNYQQEIHSYKDVCRDDVRSMQVIDKLTRLLQKIIEEQTNDTEDDRTKDNCNISVGNTVTSLPNIRYSHCKYIDQKSEPSLINKPPINLAQQQQLNQTTPELNYTKNTYNPTQEYNNITEDNFEALEIGIQEPHFNDNIDIVKNISLNVCGSENAIRSTEVIHNIMHEADEEEINPLKATREHYTRSARERKKTQRYIEKSEKRADAIANTTTEMCPGTEDDIKKAPQSKPTLHVSSNKQSRPNSRKVADTAMDLSWLEDIRYVRDVGPEEFDPKLKDTSETFWRNCTFPRDWDHRDFVAD